MRLHLKNRAFTLVELLTTIAIIAVLLGILLPSLSAVRSVAMKTKQNAQFAALDQALIAFKNEMGYYPPSDFDLSYGPGWFYCGAQKLAEALVGWDLRGFHPSSAWRADGLDINHAQWTYDPDEVRLDADGVPISYDERVGPYLDLSTANVFRLGDIPPLKTGLFSNSTNTGPATGPLAADTFVICDSFPVKKIVSPDGKVKKAGTPILYYRANAANKLMQQAQANRSRYNSRDNAPLLDLGILPDLSEQHFMSEDLSYFYNKDYKIIDQDILATTGRYWPHRPDSYILISAGPDGEYGTDDDMTNFGK